MEELGKLIKNEFGVTVEENGFIRIDEQLRTYEKNVCKKANSLVKDLNITEVSFSDSDFKLIYEHPNYIYFKKVLEFFKDIKDLKLPRKD